jgi:hypothetical protein
MIYTRGLHGVRSPLDEGQRNPMSLLPLALGTLLELATRDRRPASGPSLSKTSSDLGWLSLSGCPRG